MFNIAVIVGSLRKGSYNRKLAFALEKLNHPELNFNYLNIHDVPLFNQDDEENLPAPVVRVKNEIAEADAVLFVTPEYNRSIPGVLKNVIDWGTRPRGTNVWAGKLSAIIGTSPGSIGTAVAQSHLRSIIVSIGAILFGRPEIYLTYKEGLIDDDHNITVESTRDYLQKFLNILAEEISTFKSCSKKG